MTLKYENEDKTVTMPAGKALYAYLGNTKLPIGSNTSKIEGNTTQQETELGNGLIVKWGILKNVLFDENHYETIPFINPFKNECSAAFFSVGQTSWFDGMRTVYLISKSTSNIVCLPGYTKEQCRCDLYWFAIGY